MGIHGLGSYLRKTTKIRQSVVWKEFSRTTIAIDAFSILFRAKAENLSLITVIAALIVRIRNIAGAEPLFVFDGKPPERKHEVIEKRRYIKAVTHRRITELRNSIEVERLEGRERGLKEHEIAALTRSSPSITFAELNDVKHFLYEAGVLGITAKGEADDFLAWLSKNGSVSAVITSDYDMLPRGVNCILIPETADLTAWTQIRLDTLLRQLEISFDQFIIACILMGTDYSHKKYIPRIAIELAKEHELAVFETKMDYMELFHMFKGDGYTATIKELLDEKQKEKWEKKDQLEAEPERIKLRINAFRLPLHWSRWLAPKKLTHPLPRVV